MDPQTKPEVGMFVLGSDGEKFGEVIMIYRNYILVEKGFFFPTDYYVPRSNVDRVEERMVHLTVTTQVALQSGWGGSPPDDIEEEVGN
jgi:hypothetical protein